MSNIDLDLDILSREGKNIRLNGEVITIYPPDVFQLMTLAKIGTEMQELQAASNGDASIAADKLGQLIEEFKKLFPELKDKKLTIEQFYALMGLISSLSKPADMVEIEKRGDSIEPEKKTE